MLQIAQIRSDHGALLLPAAEPYDREIVFEEAEFRARRYGMVGLQIGSAGIRLTRSQVDTKVLCAECHQPIGHITYFAGSQPLCASCGRHSLR